MKRLFVVPVVHSLADLGSLAESVRARYLEHFGPAGWQQREQTVKKLWDDIRRTIGALHLDLPKVRIYQDGLPVCGKERQIVEELAGAGSLNHQLILDLARKGAELVGTEDPQLLIREYQLQRRQFAGAAAASPAEAAELLAARDRFIAERVAATLEDGETGLLFLGALHRLDATVIPGIEVLALDPAE